MGQRSIHRDLCTLLYMKRKAKHVKNKQKMLSIFFFFFFCLLGGGVGVVDGLAVGAGVEVSKGRPSSVAVMAFENGLENRK